MLISSPEPMDGISIVTLTGRLDASVPDGERERMVSMLEESATLARGLVFDLSGVSHIDTKGVGIVIQCHQASMRLGCKICWIIKPIQTQVHTAIKRTGLDKVLVFCDDIGDAIAKLKGVPHDRS